MRMAGKRHGLAKSERSHTDPGGRTTKQEQGSPHSSWKQELEKVVEQRQS